MKQTTRLNIVLLGVAVAVAIAVGGWLAPMPSRPVAPLTLTETTFAHLSGWHEDAIGESLAALRRSCVKLAARADDDVWQFGPISIAGHDWRQPCATADKLNPDDHDAARDYFEAAFVPFVVAAGANPVGLFTGYYEAALKGARQPSAVYATPLRAPPDDVVTIDLGAFRDALRGQRLSGRVVGRRVVPLPSRADIENGALANVAPPLLWVDDPVDAFFLHIQGSGRVNLDDGATVRVGYAGQNGHPYTAIGRVLVENGALAREQVSMQSIRQWLAAHPDQAAEIMNSNASYIFFRELDGDGPIGAQGVALTVGRSLAVDRDLIPLGTPLWLDIEVPAIDPGAPDRPWQRLVMAQDTGGAIRGPVRGDVFWGYGGDAAAVAGRMKHAGRYYALIPRTTVDRHAAPAN